ncbi:MAG: fructosamine kinase family protein [Sulfuriflexus sp.]|nr:fructosamine kinase family protein [Sulfuriflexus sp.]
MNEFNLDAICADISVSTGSPFQMENHSSVAGGDINDAYRLEGQCGREFFLKLNRVGQLDMFTAEAEGLLALAQPKVIRVPTVICYGETNTHAYLVLENIQFSRGGASGEALLGEQLAHLHQFNSAGRGYGWHRDNTIGATPQLNDWTADWVAFLREQRFAYQLELAARNGLNKSARDKGQRLLDGLGLYFESYTPEASLLHGDLWSGNAGFDSDGQPVIYDPAVYYGDRETDMAMTELFGGFSADFYTAYEQVWPLDVGYTRRRDLYKLYHILNHFNLFGGGYASQSENIIDKLLIYLS